MQTIFTDHAWSVIRNRSIVSDIRKVLDPIDDWRFSTNGNPEFLIMDQDKVWWHSATEQCIDRSGNLYLNFINFHKIGENRGYNKFSLLTATRNGKLSDVKRELIRIAPGKDGYSWIKKLKMFFNLGVLKATTFSPNVVIIKGELFIRQGEWKREYGLNAKVYTPVFKMTFKNGKVIISDDEMKYIVTTDTTVSVTTSCPKTARGKSYWACKYKPV